MSDARAAAPVQAFAYHRSVAPMMWVLVGIATVELAVVHLMLALWWPAMAIVVSLLTVAGIAWLIRAIASFRRLPVTLDRDELVMRVGTLKRIAAPIGAIEGVSGELDRAALKAAGASNFALIAHPNVVVRLSAAAGPRARHVRALAHRLDDAPAFLRAIDAIRARHD